MAVRIDEKNKEINIGVGDLIAEEILRGSLSGGGMAVERMAVGRAVHEEHCEMMMTQFPSYRREVYIKFETEVEHYRVIIHGRIDGMYEENGETVVEEIKSSLLEGKDLNGIDKNKLERYYTQLRLYLYFLEEQGLKEIQGRLILISLIDQGISTMPLEFEGGEVQSTIETKVREIIRIHEEEMKRDNLRKEAAGRVEFPFLKLRRYQGEMMESVEKALEEKQNLLLEAPTGIGKTAASLTPALAYALGHGKKVFFATSKGTGSQIVARTLVDLKKKGAEFSALFLRAKRRMCANDIFFCNPDFCTYAKDYYAKLGGSSILEELLEMGVIEPESIFKEARLEELCPFEVSLDLTFRADIIVCDYNYIFDPEVYLRRFFGGTKYDDLILIIDEAHNLYSRGRDYYSPELRRGDIRSLLSAIIHEQGLALDLLVEFLEELDRYLERLQRSGREEFGNAPIGLVGVDVDFFTDCKERLDEITLSYFLFKKTRSLSPSAGPGTDDPVVDFINSFNRFYNVLVIGGGEFSYILDCSEGDAILKILCKDPSRQLGKRMAGFHSVIAMSATLTPISFYKDVLGFPTEETNLLEYPSPFPPENRKIMVVDEVSTKYRERIRYLDKTASIISNIVGKRHGNYFAFFPSFQYLRQVGSRLQVPSYDIVSQDESMTEDERRRLLERLKKPGNLILAIQGGIFAEGVDYPGEMLIGAIIVGPGLPRVSFEQELIKEHYQDHYEQGFEYAYLYPGMNRVVQSAGRVIRSEDDSGVVVLLDKRFATPFYSKSFPESWYNDSPAELVSRDYQRDLEEFWDSL